MEHSPIVKKQPNYFAKPTCVGMNVGISTSLKQLSNDIFSPIVRIPAKPVAIPMYCSME